METILDISWASYFPAFKLIAVAIVVMLVLRLVTPWLTKLLVRITQPFQFLNLVANNIKRPIHWLIPLIGTYVVVHSPPDEIPFLAPLQKLVTLAVIAATTWLAITAVRAIQAIIIAKNPMDLSDNLSARRIQTQTRVLVQTLSFFVLLFGLAAMLMTFPSARQFGTSLLASAGVAGLAVGFAAKPVLGNLIAGLQLAITQPIRLDDVVIVENEWGRVEEITGTYIVIRIWDDRRLIVPLQWFIENPFQNWTRKTSSLLGSIFLWVDYSTNIEQLREELKRLCEQVPELWDGRVCGLQVTESNENSVQLRMLVSSNDSSKNWDLRCFIREKMINFMMQNQPECLPKLRATISENESAPTPPNEQIETPERQPPV
ncbi:mechanosensitive ion channel family protein [Cellvibrio sp. NN19]|uniref:mechanosensitive ion channel family protein n=1 Tax=Cellvibrio chitinivorans TaxID=3102792 RepID=UPI002B413333|nr:mechanosensitive ion channel domain-containing protein [Cellvibrio sp. NN19]